MPQTIHASAEATQQWTSEPPVKWDGDAQALERELRRVLQGDVGFDNGSRALYATDASNYRQVPIGVVCPANVTDVEETLRICRRFGAPVLGRGGGTSLAGQCCNIAVVMDMSRHFNQILSIDPQRRVARVRPGTVLDNLRDAAEEDHLTFGPDPATHNHCTLGGMIGNNSCGVHSVLAGRTVDNVESLEVITYDGFRLTVGKTSEDELEAIIRSGGRRGDIYRGLKALRDKYAELIRQRYPDIPRRVSGYNLDQLLPEKGFHVARALVGTEGTCVTVLEAELRLIHSPPKRALALIGFDDAYHAADYVMEVMEHGPVGLEGLDRRLVEDNRKKGMNTRDLQMFPDGGGWLLVEFGAETREEARQQAAGMIRELEGKEHVTG
ncbi:MAG: FAD-binding oxidoreductase, partial [Planctomycetales bacterium]|nr:FAD-binding oxidoreductase [Planctomycetales bacterium]